LLETTIPLLPSAIFALPMYGQAGLTPVLIAAAGDAGAWEGRPAQRGVKGTISQGRPRQTVDTLLGMTRRP
jgi:hypothetical protein